MTHHTHPTLLERFDVALIGAGGNGSQMLTCLARLHHAMVACNGRLAWDPHPSRAGLVGPMSHNGKWEIGLIVKGGTLA